MLTPTQDNSSKVWIKTWNRFITPLTLQLPAPVEEGQNVGQVTRVAIWGATLRPFKNLFLLCLPLEFDSRGVQIDGFAVELPECYSCLGNSGSYSPKICTLLPDGP